MEAWGAGREVLEGRIGRIVERGGGRVGGIGGPIGGIAGRAEGIGGAVGNCGRRIWGRRDGRVMGGWGGGGGVKRLKGERLKGERVKGERWKGERVKGERLKGDSPEVFEEGGRPSA